MSGKLKFVVRFFIFQDVRQTEVCRTVRRLRACLLMAPRTMTEIIVATIPKKINQVFCGLSNVNSESPTPTKTTAEERGSIPTNVPTIKDLSGTRAAAIKKLVNAKGIAGESRSREIINAARQTLCPTKAS